MKEMEAKTENRYEYRKPQEKRKQMIAPDLFEFAYVPDWYGHLAELERLALPESWKFRKPSRETKNADTPILERYIHTIFRKQVIDFNSESDPRKADSIFHLENECVCFHTGLYTPQYKGIYGYFERNNFSDSLRDWYFRGFCDELSPKLRYIEPLPQKPVYHMAQSGINFNPEWPIRVNVNHILGDEENLERIPAKIRKVKNLPLLFETAVELGRRKSVIEPGLVVPQGYQGRVQYLLPVYLTNMQKPDLAMTLTVMDGYYLGNTCLTLEMAYLNARVVASQSGSYLTVEPKKGSTVPVLVWRISERDEHYLDRYEGCPSFYYKKMIRVEIQPFIGEKVNGGTEAIIYIMHEDRPLGCPTKHYYDVCLEGYCRFGFKQTVLEQALYDSVGKRVGQHLLKEVGYYYE